MRPIRLMPRLLRSLLISLIVPATLAGAQAQPARPAVPVAPVSDKDFRATQDELLRMLRLSPTLTTVVSHDPSLLSNQEYVSHNNPQLAAFLAAHPEVARNPDFYLFTRVHHDDGSPNEELQRAVWPEFRAEVNPKDHSERGLLVGPPRNGIYMFAADSARKQISVVSPPSKATRK